MKSFRLKERFQILRDRLYSHVVLKEALNRIDGKLLLLLDHQLDIQKLKPAVGNLRLKQETCFQILRILKRIADMEAIPFWLDFGTLLGAVRHDGFIPWDDDLDISLLNPDFDRFCSALQKKLPLQLVLQPGKASPGDDIGIARVLEKNTGFYIDIYPYDRIPGALRSDGTTTKWQLDYEREFETVFRLGVSHGLTMALKNRILDWYEAHAQGDGTEDGIASSMFYFQSSPMYRKVFSVSDMFPLKKHVFEGEEFLIPRNPERILFEIYGDILRFPRDAGNLTGHGQTLATPQTIRRVIDQLNEVVRRMDNS